jgi:hypothetical protein
MWNSEACNDHAEGHAACSKNKRRKNVRIKNKWYLDKKKERKRGKMKNEY